MNKVQIRRNLLRLARHSRRLGNHSYPRVRSEIEAAARGSDRNQLPCPRFSQGENMDRNDPESFWVEQVRPGRKLACKTEDFCLLRDPSEPLPISAEVHNLWSSANRQYSARFIPGASLRTSMTLLADNE
jgi:hypothetical protein